MTHASEMNVEQYIIFIAKSLISFFSMLFQNPIKAINTPEHLFALGHVVVIFGLLIPTR